ncbi:MAG TPA: hypothetical protein VKA46_12095, partial [Gemmataceae bacterium]|nr:hypothetical protein [Gemmataceae bacterium]
MFDGWLRNFKKRTHETSKPRRVRTAQAKPSGRYYHPILEPLEDRVAPAAVSWAVGQSGYWDVGSNWSTGQVPGASDDVIINRSVANLTITYRQGNDSIHSLQSNEVLDVSGGSLNIAAASAVSTVAISNAAQVTAAATTWSDVTVDNATLTTDGEQDMASLSVLDGGVLTHAANSATTTHLLDLHVTGTLMVDAASRIDVSGKGYGQFRTTGNTTNGAATGYSGGSYGGLGGLRFGSGSTNAVYGDYADPNDWGSGGTASGGGLVRITAGTLTLDGQILARGGSNEGAGAGGGIYVAVTTLQGAGSIDATGGNGTYGGAGGGGRVAVYAQDWSGFNLSKVTALGGVGNSDGGAGTVYLKKTGDAYGTLIIDAGAGGSGTTPLGLPGETSHTFPDAVVIRGGNTNVQPEHAALALDFENAVTVQNSAALSFPGDFHLPAAAGLTVTAGGALYVAGSMPLDGSLTLTSGGQVQVAGTMTAASPLTVSGGTLIASQFVAPAVSVVNGGILTSLTSTTSQMYKLVVQVTGTLIVDAASRIDVSGKGYGQFRTTGNTTNGAATGYSGGSYGGLGGLRFGSG